jgi:predicted Zn finger-like uncharacterized protein
MAETQITRCPHCQTTFRIRLEQLAKAKGAVRCGSCLQVFKAGDHLVSNTPNLKAVVSKPAAPKRAVPKAAVRPTVKPANKPAPVKKSAPKAQTPKPIPKQAPKPKREEISFDDIPDQINDDPLEDFGIRQPDRKTGETFDSNLQLDDSIFSMQESAKPSRYSLLDQDRDLDFDLSSDFDNDNFSSNGSDESWASNLMDDENKSSLKPAADDESWADALLDVDDELIEDIEPSYTKANTPREKDDFVLPLDDDSEDDQFHLGGDDNFEQETIEIELSIANSVNDLLDEPLNLGNKNKKKLPKPKHSSFLWLWSTGSLIMLFAMIIQVGYFKFDTWSRNPDYRPAYAMTCQIIECKLPAIQNINEMNTQHFMVRLHPDVEQALYIDTLLVNNAPYPQPFPDLHLVFTGLENQIIASRRFDPKEYLAGELAGATVMPLKVPIHIALEIMNPGAEAVGYHIELTANH